MGRITAAGAGTEATGDTMDPIGVIVVIGAILPAATGDNSLNTLKK